MCESKSTQETTIPPASASEERLMRLFEQQLLPAMLEESGFRFIAPDAKKVAEVEQAIKRQEEALQWATEHEETLSKKAGRSKDQAEHAETKRRIEEGLASLREEQAALTPKIEKIFPPDIEKLRDEFGEDSEQFQQAVKEFEGEKFASEERQNQIIKRFQENTLKFLEGDFSQTEAEKNAINELFAPERKIVEEFDKNQKALIEKGIKDTADQIVRQVQERAVASGRDPNDPEFQNQIATNVADVAGDARLALEGDILSRQQGIEQGIRNLRISQLTGGGTPAIQSSQLTDAINQQRLLNLQGASGAAQGQFNTLAGLRAAQPTTTQTSTPSPLSIGLGVGSLALGGFTGFATANALRQLANAQGGT